MNEINTTEKEELPSPNSRQVLLVAIPMFILITGIVFNIALKYEPFNTPQGSIEELIVNSPAHAILIPAYKDCMDDPYIRASTGDCLLYIKSYSDIKGLRDQYSQVAYDIRSFYKNKK